MSSKQCDAPLASADVLVQSWRDRTQRLDSPAGSPGLKFHRSPRCRVMGDMVNMAYLTGIGRVSEPMWISMDIQALISPADIGLTESVS